MSRLFRKLCWLGTFWITMVSILSLSCRKGVWPEEDHRGEPPAVDVLFDLHHARAPQKSRRSPDATENRVKGYAEAA
jgi:hypothetical protein